MMAEEFTSPAALLEKALAYSQAEHAEVSYQEAREASTRFANNAITQNVAKRNGALTVKAAFGQQTGQATVTDLSEDGIRNCVAQAEAIARASQPDTEYLPPPGPQAYPAVRSYDERVARATPDDRAAGIRQATAEAERRGLQSAGSLATNAYQYALANSAGLYHEQLLSSTQFVCTAMSGDSSGWAQSGGYRWEHVTPGENAARAGEKALVGREPQDLPPGEYTVILEPAAVGDFFGFLAWTMDAKAAHEGRSAFTGKEGERIGVPGISLRSQPDHAEVPTRAFAEDGLRAPATTWIEDGVLQTLSYDRFWAERSGHAFTGRAQNLVMGGGEQSLEELIGSVERGVLVTRFWYIRFVDPMKLLLTGMTRDGVFLIEDGKVSRGLRNMRFNESPLRCLERVSALGRNESAGRYEFCYVPALRIEQFRFTSGTAF